MTTEKAIQCLDHSWIVNDYGNTDMMRIEAGRIAIEALKKQIPKTPDFIADGYADGELVYDTWVCPNCEQHYEIEYEKYDYCPNCGQYIDWNEVTE